MITNLKTPGVYIEEISKFPPSVAAVETAIPAFIGYTEKTEFKGQNLVGKPARISSLVEYVQIFGGPALVGNLSLTLDETGQVSSGLPADLNGQDANRFKMYYSLAMFFANGGGPCYIIAVNNYESAPGTFRTVSSTDLLTGLTALAKEDEPTLILLPDLVSIASAADFHSVLVPALKQCADLGDRFLICDIYDGYNAGTTETDAFRNGIGINNLKYGGVYHPWINTTIQFQYEESSITLSQINMRDDKDAIVASSINGQTLAALKTSNPKYYSQIKIVLQKQTVTLPPSSAMAGIYAAVDNTRGVWKAPANVSLNNVRKLTVKIDNDFQDDLNVHPTGKSINALRFFSGKGNLVWGARTLAGNDNEWRYISVRRFYNMVEESVKKSTERFVFEPNDANTWTKVRSMIENFLVLQWRAGALAGAKPEDAFFVKVGLGETMTPLDILEGRMNVEIGMAVVRPAEFIILQFSHKMVESG